MQGGIGVEMVREGRCDLGHTCRVSAAGPFQDDGVKGRIILQDAAAAGADFWKQDMHLQLVSRIRMYASIAAEPGLSVCL